MTNLHPAKPRRALVVIDVQQEYLDGMLTIGYPDPSRSIVEIGRAMDAAAASAIPVVVFQHEFPAGAPLFAPGSKSHSLHPEIERRAHLAAMRVSKRFASIFEGAGFLDWVRSQQIDTLSLTGYMTNNCVLASAAAAEPLGLTVEVLSDATGAPPLSNAAGAASAETIHKSVMTLLHSNWAAVTTTSGWIDALRSGVPIAKGGLPPSALAGRASN